MRITTTMAILAAVTGMSARAEMPLETVAVYVVDGATAPAHITYPAKMLATRMFAEIGIRLEWRRGKMPAGAPGRPIEVVYDTNTPPDFKRGALAYALPFEGIHIHVFYDRVERSGQSNATWLLAHVLVHEITHILQGVARHSPEGVMKADWNGLDIAAMRRKPLPFTADDLKFIRRGMENREHASVAAVRFDDAAVLAR